MATKEPPSTQLKTCGPSQVVTQAPRAPASAWLASVATRIPSTIGQGLRKRTARISANNCVLSPISASATIPVETKNASIAGILPRLQTWVTCDLQNMLGTAMAWATPKKPGQYPDQGPG